MPALCHVWDSLCNLSRPFSLGCEFPTSASSQNVPASGCFPLSELLVCAMPLSQGRSATGIRGSRRHFTKQRGLEEYPLTTPSVQWCSLYFRNLSHISVAVHMGRLFIETYSVICNNNNIPLLLKLW